MHVLGIDAGGTKTLCLLADAQGAVVSEARGPGANFLASGAQAVEAVLRDVMAAAIGGRAIQPAAICLGIAGVDREDDGRVVEAIVRRLGPASRILVVNDALIALVAGAGESPGIVIIAGTGSIVYGRNAAFEAARAGGWGHILGDEGSGYWIGREALAAVVRAADGRGPATRLLDEILGHFQVDDASRLPRVVYDTELPRASVSALGPIVQRACERGDAVAARILERAGEDLAAAAAAVAGRLAMRGDAFPFVLAGGVFRVVPRLAADLPRRLIEIAPRSDVRLLEHEPATGAVHLALADAEGRARVPVYKPGPV
jgi:N-acetylglucosamine kinase-like BadF-type ATPase